MKHTTEVIAGQENMSVIMNIKTASKEKLCSKNEYI